MKLPKKDNNGLEVDAIKKKVASGAAILTGRNILIQAITFLSVALLTVYLSPVEYGVFFIVSAVVNFLAYFGDIGLAAALIQKKESLTNTDLKTVFTVQQLLIIILLITILGLTPTVKRFYNLGDPAVYLLWACGFSLLLSSLKTIPTVLMERRLEFNKWVIPQLIEVLVFNLVAVYLAFRGFGVTSFTIAVLLRGAAGLFATFIIQPWMPGLSLSLKSLKGILKFGIPYQANTLLAMVKDDGMILFLGGVLGTSGVGLLGWAQKWAFAPLRFFMDQVIKVTFPAFSKLQAKKSELEDLLSKSIFFVCLLVFPTLVFLVLTAPTLIEIIPKYSKWESALLALYILSASSALAAITTPLTNTLNAIGKISITFRLMLLWTAATWVLVPPLAILYGLNGAAVGLTLVGMTSFFALFIISKFVAINYWFSVGKPAIGVFALGVVTIFVKSIVPTSILQVVCMLLSGLVVYTTVILFLEPNLLTLAKKILQRKKSG